MTKKKKTGSLPKLIGCFVILAILLGAVWGVGSLLKNVFLDGGENVAQETETPNVRRARIVDETLESLSDEELIYQMMFVTPEDITGVGTVVAAGETTRAALEKYPVGGLIYFAKNLEDREQTMEMIKNSQKFSKLPLFIAVDEEGGRVARLGNNEKMGTTKLPPMKEIGDSGDPRRAYEAGKILGTDLKALGFNVDFAPDADVIVNVKNSEIGDRSFGTDPQLVAEMVDNVVRGMEECGVSATLKHFPGHGSTYVDSHTGYSESARTFEELKECEFLPFALGVEAGADFVMVSHMTLVNATEEKVPSSLSKEVITGWLREELGYQGIIITDSFSMGAITDSYTPGQAAVKAVKAGCDMILMSRDMKSAHKAILDAMDSGEISRERILESVRRILLVKYDKGMLG